MKKFEIANAIINKIKIIGSTFLNTTNTSLSFLNYIIIGNPLDIPKLTFLFHFSIINNLKEDGEYTNDP